MGPLLLIGALLLGPVVEASEPLCARPPNPIVAENCRAGSPSTEWDVNGMGSDDVQGFATRASVAPGQRIEFKITLTEAASALRVDVYRLGYYTGAGARKVGEASLVPEAITLARDQPPCTDDDLVVDCGNPNSNPNPSPSSNPSSNPNPLTLALAVAPALTLTYDR